MSFKTLNKGFNKYRNITKKDKECINSRLEVKESNNKEYLICKKLNITIEEDWIKELEDGLRHISEAINQERQFIKTNGEVVPIEKVKRVSKASIVHLARHSDLISTLPEEGEILIPDKLYMEEKLNDYSVYENRFLFTLLSLIQQFVTMRLDQINEVINTYSGQLYLNKTVENKTHKLSFQMKFNEERFDVKNEKITRETMMLIDRLDMVSREVISLLSCNLMKEVSKAPLVKPPLVKTNVLKGNKNFKAAVLLYDFVNAFDRNGYEVEVISEDFEFNNEISDEFAEIINLSSFLTYKFANHLTEKFVEEIEEDEKFEKEKQNKILQEKINKIKSKVEELGIPIEEYVIMLEKRNDTLEQENFKIVEYKQQVEEAKNELNEVNASLDKYTESNIKLLSSLNDKIKEVTELNKQIDSNNKQLEQQEFNYETKLTTIKDETTKELQVSHELDLNEKDLEMKQLEELHNTHLNEKDLEIKKLQEDLLKMEKNRNFIAAQLIAFRSENNLLTNLDDYSSKERFTELEKQFFAFEDFFSDEWKKAKKKIRKQYLNK